MAGALQLPATPEDFLRLAVEPALQLLPAAMDSMQARVMLVAIAPQESGLAHRWQIVEGRPTAKGPARGLLQFEAGGACTGVLRHDASRYWMHWVCGKRGCAPLPTALWRTIETDDVLAVVAGRLLLFTDPKRLPELGDEAGAWNLYARTWRPGKPHRKTWAAHYRKALECVVGVEA